MKKQPRTATPEITPEQFDEMHDAGVDISAYVDDGFALRPGRAVQRVNVDFRAVKSRGSAGPASILTASARRWHERWRASSAPGRYAMAPSLTDGKLGWDRIKGQGFYLQFNVAGLADVDAAAARIKAAGGTLIDEPADRDWGVRMFQFRDLDGFKLGVSTPLAG